jgi:DNA-binding response OmpR family regulator
METRILLAEDDLKLAEVIVRYLHREGYVVTHVGDGREAIDSTRRESIDLVVLDLMLPRVDGWDVCRILRAESTIPILILTAMSAEDDMLLGLDLGADDYMTKPFSPPQLMARIRTLLRRTRRIESQPGAPIVLGPLVIDALRHRVELSGTTLECTPAEFALLETMASRPGQVFSRTQLLESLHGHSHLTERTIDGHVKNLRRKIEADPQQPALLRTVFGVGYKMTAPEAV